MTLKKLSLSVFISILALVVTGGVLLQGQQRFMLNQEEASQFRLAKQLFQSGKQYLAKERFINAEKAFKTCLEKFSRFSYADYALAQIYYQQKKYSQALEHIKKAKKSYEFIAKLGASAQMEYLDKLREQKQTLQDQGLDLKQYVDNARRNSVADGGDGNAETKKSALRFLSSRDNLQHGQTTIGRIDQRTLTPVAKGTDIPGGYYYIHGNILFKVKRFRAAMDQYMKAVKIEPTFGDAYNNIANLYFMARQYGKAKSYLEKAEKNGGKVNAGFKQAIQKALETVKE